MKHTFTFALAALALDVTASPLEARQQGSGTGPFAPGTYKTDSSLQGDWQRKDSRARLG
ncbi:hypothetical protein HBI25_217990 [Parastagonospora nodorum]|nr:hypothetical protein HBH52_226410 [Parastagonospora nodorum]KAH4251835.1 hypothetical protein HBI03_217850 [Parastagonospora nodorum]KAH4258737.1 hypothetical protein HBI04_216170 [Parastagonospora nodorum]KAH4800467.1 hypothetical protein HBH61_211830 [Parastagonospora nodorum]KAH5090582.1 hypothetical protein HBH72_215220 [Parastagonospora nodorum]